MSIRIDGTNTTANPGITGGDADTGLQFGTDEVSIVTGGTNRVEVNASNAAVVTIPQNGNQLLLKQSDTDSGYLLGCNNINGDLTFSRRALGANTERVVFEADGTVALKNHPECLVYRLNNSISGGDASAHTLNFNNIIYARGGFSLSSNKLIVPKTGWYRCRFGFESAITNSAYGIRAINITPKINGSVVARAYSGYHNVTTGSVSSNLHYSFDDIFYLNLTANDQIDLQLIWYPGSTQSENFVSWAQMFYIG